MIITTFTKEEFEAVLSGLEALVTGNNDVATFSTNISNQQLKTIATKVRDRLLSEEYRIENY